MSASPSRLQANRANAQLSTGPKSPDGKEKSSLNAVKTGLTGRTVLLPSDDAVVYREHVQRFLNRYEPATDEERELTHQLADTEWRLLRIPTLESGIYALGRRELAANHQTQDAPAEDPAIVAAMLEAQILIAYSRQLNNLSIQESRLRRYFDKAEAKLKELQKPRKELRSRQIAEATNLLLASRKSQEPFHFEALGFDFAIDPVLERAAQILTQRERSDSPLIRARQLLRELQSETLPDRDSRAALV